MSEFIIEKGVPIPEGGGVGRPKGSGLYGAMRKMEVGDSIFIATNNKKFAASSPGLKPKKYTQRKIEGGFRIWRIE